MGQSSALAAQRLDLAERVAANHGLLAVGSHIIAIVDCWEAGRGITDAELMALRFVLACSLEGEGYRNRQKDLGDGTAGGGLRTKSPPPFFPHQRRQ